MTRKLRRLEVGDKVRLTEDRHAWYSGYGMNPVRIIGTDEVGTVRSINVPNVRGREGSYVVVDFPTGDKRDAISLHSDADFVLA